MRYLGTRPPLRPQELEVARQELERRTDLIRDGFAERRHRRDNGEVLPPCETAESFLKIKTYRLMKDSDTERARADVPRFVRQARIDPRKPSFRKNPFYWGLLAVDPDRLLLSKQSISLYSRQLLYAHRHGVPAELLIGFIYQLGGATELSAKLESGAREFPPLRMRVSIPSW